MNRIYLAVTNDLITDNRVNKVACTLLQSGNHITIIGRVKKDSPPIGSRPYHTKRFKLIFNKGAFFYLEFNLRLFFYLITHKFDLIVANDLDTLTGSYFASVFKFKKIVYDSHEYFTEVPELVNRKFTKKVWTIIERLILPRIKVSYTVSESIATTYKSLYGVEMKVVRNVPHLITNKKAVSSNFNTKQILYQGAINVGRGLEHMIDAMEFIENAKFTIIGDGDITNQLKERVKNKNLQNKIEFKKRIPFSELIQETSKADLGIALEENLGLNYYYALPNKLFDYIQAGVPVLVSPFPEMQKIVNQFEVGTVYNHKNPLELAKKITEIFELKNRYQKWKDNCESAAKELCWEKEELILIDLYSKMGLSFKIELT